MSDNNATSDESTGTQATPEADTHAIDYEGMARTMVFQSMLDHPLPWRIESDWTQEVRASDGYIVAKCKTAEEAQAIINFAERMRAELVAFDVEFEAMMTAD